MSIYCLTAKADDYGFTDRIEAVRRTRAGGVYADSWRVMSRQIQIDDEVFLLKQGKSPKGIVAHGRVVRGSYDHFKSRTGSGGPSPRIDVEFDVVLGAGEEPLAWPLPGHEYSGQFRGPFGSGVALADELVADMERLWAQHILDLRR